MTEKTSKELKFLGDYFFHYSSKLKEIGLKKIIKNWFETNGFQLKISMNFAYVLLYLPIIR